MKISKEGSFVSQLNRAENSTDVMLDILNSLTRELAKWTDKFCLIDRHLIVFALRRVADGLYGDMSFLEKLALRHLEKNIETTMISYPSNKGRDDDDT